MLTVDAYLRAALETHQMGRVRAVASYQGVNTSIPVGDGSITFNGDGEVQATGSFTAYGVGSSLVPKAKTDPLAPYGQEVSFFREVDIRGTVFSVPLGVYRITDAGNAYERTRGGVVVDWSVEVAFADQLERVRADDFLAVESPKAGNTVWDEVRRLSRLPVQENLGDTSVPRATVYESRIKSVETLFAMLGGVPHLTRTGVLTARVKDAWLTVTAPAFDLSGAITFPPARMSNDFVNQVQVTSSNDATIVEYARIDSDADPLSVNRAGGRTFKHSGPYTSRTAARVDAGVFLRQLSERRARTVSVECTPEALLLELGDVGWVRDSVQGRAVFGEVAALRVPFDVTAPVGVDLIVAVES